MRKLFLLLAFTLVIAACNKKDKTRDSVLGSWNCEHFSDISQPQTYQASITRSPIIDSLYVVSNFHNFGWNEENEVYFTIDENGDLIIESVYLVNQSIVVSGKGIVAEDYSQINWSYTINNGTLEHVEAIYD